MTVFRQTDHPLSQEEITQWLRELRGNPYVPASNFDVTAVFRAKLGSNQNFYFAGTNVESLHHRLSTHGEEGAIAAMVTALGKKAEIVEGWVMGAPRALKPGSEDPLANNGVSCCGKCRQQIVGFADASVPIHGVSLNGEVSSTTVGEFLPGAFTFREFAPELMATDEEAAIVPTPTEQEIKSKIIRQGKELSEPEIKDWLNKLEGFDLASKRSQAVLLKLANGAYVAGVNVEEAAYQSIDPVQAAMAIAHAEFGNQKVVAVYTASKGRDEVDIPTDHSSTLTGSAIQVLNEFSANQNIPIHMYNAKGEARTIKLKDAGRYIPTFQQPSRDIGVERFVN